jgi:hypothetical protein
MAKYRRKNVKLFGSKLPETTFQTPPATAADYEAFVTQEPVIIIPTVDKTTDAGNAGTGTPFPTHACNDYWRPAAVALSTQLEYFGFFSRLWLRLFGGAVVTAAEGAGYRHEAKLQSDAEGSQLPSTTLIHQLGPLDIILPGLTPDQGSIQMQRGSRPVLGVNLINTGKHNRPNGVADLVNYSAPGVCAGGGNITLKYTNASAAVVDLGAAGCRFVDFNVGVQQQLNADDRCPGDPELTVDSATASYRRNVPRTDPIIPVSFGILIDSTVPEYLIHARNEQVTDLIVGIKGPVIGGAVRYEVGIRIPKANFLEPVEVDSNGDAAMRMTVLPLYDATSDTAAIGYAINTTAANFK